MINHRYMIETGMSDGSGVSTHQVVATLDELNATVRDACGSRDVWGRPDIYNRCLHNGGNITLPDGRTITVTPVVWRARGYVRADVSAFGQPDNLPLDNGMTTR